MYTQGCHNSQPGQGPQKPMSSQYQQHLPGPPPPLPQFQQGPSGFTLYQHGPAAPHQIPPGGLPNTGQFYLHPPVHVHGGAPLPHMYSTAQQSSHHHSHLATQNAHNMPQRVLPPPISASHPEVSQTQPPLSALPPPPPPQSQGQTFYRAPVNPLPQQPGLQHISSHPPLPPTTSFFTSAPLGSFMRSSGGDHHVLSATPLPPPLPLCSPPPILPSPPPSTSTPFSSSKAVQNASNLPCNLDSDGSKLSASGSVDDVATPVQVKHNLVAGNGSLNMGGGNICDMVSLVGDKLSLQEGLTMDLSSTPPKPIDENVIEKIEALCQCIAKNGPDYEDMIRKNESGNPGYSFLYGGELGSEAAVAHDFFLWMKKKSLLACKSDKQQGDSSLRRSENKPSEQPCHLVTAAASRSPDYSDMEMEDDITQIDDQGMNHPLKGMNSQCDINDDMLNVEDQIHPLQISAECSAYKGILSEKESAAGSSRLGEQGPEGISNADQMVFGASVSKIILVNLTVPTEHSLVTSLEKSNTSSQLAKDGSPFRLLQDYASDDNSEKDVETCIANTSVPFGANLGRDAGSSLENASSLRQTEKGFGPLSLSSMPSAVASSEVVEGTITTSIIDGNEQADNKHVHQVSINHAASGEVLQKENVMLGASVDSVKLSKERRQEEENLTLGSTQHKVDKFGRLVRNGASDSDSDDLHYIGRHRRGRTRSRSQSCSPPDRRRRRSRSRSPWRRRKKRSLSRSWSPRNRRSRSRSPRNRRSRSRSPRNRRSRSRSPNFRSADEFSGENKRRVKGQMPVCFDFRRGRCYRGASCRYLHNDSGKSDEPKRQRSKQYPEFPHSSRTNVREEIMRISEKVGDHEHGEVRGPEVKPYSNFVASRDRKINQKREDSVGRGVHNQDGQSTEYHMVKSEKSRDIPASVIETQLVENKQEGPNPITNENCQEAVAESHHTSTVDALLVGNITQSCGNASQKINTSQSVDKSSLSIPLGPACQNADCLLQQSDNLWISGSSRKTCTSSPSRLPESNAHPNTMELHNHPSHIPSSSLPCSHDVDNQHMKQQQTASSKFQSSGESFPSYMLPNQPSYFALQPNSSLTSLPPPTSLPPQDSSRFRQSHLPLRNDFGSQVIQRPYPTELPAYSQSDGCQQRAYLPIQEANRPFLNASLPVCSLPIQQFGAPSMLRDNGLTQPPMHNVIASNSVAQGNSHPHTMPFSQQLLGNKMQPFPGQSLPPGGLSNSSSYIHPYSQQQQTPHSLHHPMVDSIYNLTVKRDSSLKDLPAIRDTKTFDIGGSTSSTFPNPYASTLDQSINSKYSSDVLKQEKDTTYNNTPFSSSPAPVDGRSIRSQQATSSPNSARAIGQNFPRPAGDQYDPLFDSIEPSSRLSIKFDYIQKLEVTGDSDIFLGFNGSNQPLDMEENNKRKDAGAVASVASADNEEFGEIADAEVGAVENGSPSNPVEVNLATGGIEIDQIKSPGKSKKSKDSRSMKLFKVALANFVKEVLKPSWQQGNMSKEAFKTIVKKTVDKASGAMKSHQIPKSRAKIDHYIESSQSKLTKLVMGYVDKYVKV